MPAAISSVWRNSSPSAVSDSLQTEGGPVTGGDLLACRASVLQSAGSDETRLYVPLFGAHPGVPVKSFQWSANESLHSMCAMCI